MIQKPAMLDRLCFVALLLVLSGWSGYASAQLPIPTLESDKPPLPSVEHLPSPWATLKASADTAGVAYSDTTTLSNWIRTVSAEEVLDAEPIEMFEAVLPPGPQKYPRLKQNRSGFFQDASFSGSWIAPSSGNGLGIYAFQLSSTVAAPLPNRDWPIVITPGFNVRFMDGPTAPDLPARLYDAYTRFVWLPRMNKTWGAILAITPGVFSDFKASTKDSWRFPAAAMVRWRPVPDELEFLFGIVYLDRPDIEYLPALGVVWNPDPDINLELVFPRPRIGRRIYANGSSEDWVYLAGELGGESWAIIRDSGALDRVTSLDVRLLVGAERRFAKGLGWKLEVGWVFARNLEYQSATPDFEPADSLIVRGGVTF